jgi:hypothetical protein
MTDCLEQRDVFCAVGIGVTLLQADSVLLRKLSYGDQLPPAETGFSLQPARQVAVPELQFGAKNVFDTEATGKWLYLVAGRGADDYHCVALPLMRPDHLPDLREDLGREVLTKYLLAQLLQVVLGNTLQVANR